MSLPPWSEVWDMLLRLLGPSLSASLLVMFAVRYLWGERLAGVAAAAALAVGVLAGNFFRDAMPFRLDSDRPLSVSDLRTVLGWSLEARPAIGDPDVAAALPPAAPARYWIPWLGGLAVLVDLAVRMPRIPAAVGWTVRSFVAVLAARLLTPASLRIEMPWFPWMLGAAILLQWAVLIGLARRWTDGSVALAAAGCFATASIVVLHAHSARLTDIALLFCAALLGPAIISRKWPGDIGPALSAAAIVLPGLMLTTQQETFSEVPLWSFVLAGLAPLALAIALLPKLTTQQGWKRWLIGIGLPLVPATAAVILAMQAETLQF